MLLSFTTKPFIEFESMVLDLFGELGSRFLTEEGIGLTLWYAKSGHVATYRHTDGKCWVFDHALHDVLPAAANPFFHKPTVDGMYATANGMWRRFSNGVWHLPYADYEQAEKSSIGTNPPDVWYDYLRLQVAPAVCPPRIKGQRYDRDEFPVAWADEHLWLVQDKMRVGKMLRVGSGVLRNPVTGEKVNCDKFDAYMFDGRIIPVTRLKGGNYVVVQDYSRKCVSDPLLCERVTGVAVPKRAHA